MEEQALLVAIAAFGNEELIFQLPNSHVDYYTVKRFLLPDHLWLHPDPNMYG